MIALFSVSIILGVLLLLTFFPIFLHFLLFFEILFPVFISICVGFLQIPTFFAKKWIILKAKERRKKFKDLIVIGITGSYGKTSTKEFLFQLLSEKYRVLKTEGNQNTEIGVAQTVLQKLNRKHEIFICEMAAYRKGEIKAICDITEPKIGILTGISEQHISLFGSLKNIINTKYELITSLPEDGIAIFNVANKECQKLAQRTTIKKYLYSGREGDFDVFARDINETEDFVEFEIVTKKRTERIKLNLLGKQNIENFLGAVTCALGLGLTFPRIKKAASKISSVKTAMERKEGRNGVTIIDDSYSQNPDGVFAAIDYLKDYSGKKIIIMPCLIELGKSAPSIHKNIGRRIGEVCDLAIVTTSYYFKELKLGAQEVGMKEDKILFLQSPKEILDKLERYSKKGNVILIEGRMPDKIKDFIEIH
jgi:UDP-N-acetylmuramoyl-tripeptide--D-alanyl-D-alanine ligase